jgi:hypothetical protein
MKQNAFIAVIFVLLGAILLPAASRAETRALIAGVWKFDSPMMPDLKGPENDLAAIEAVVRGQGAGDVTVLRNAEVTRTTIETALHALGLRAKPGDWIVFYYSGHGAEAEADIKGTADGDTNQFIPLAGFDPDRQDAERFIVDKDFYAWMARYIPADVHILMIADTCHSGTLNRSVDAAAFRFVPRLAFRGDAAQFSLIARPTPRFAAINPGADIAVGAGSGAVHAIDRPDLANLVYIGAAQDDQLALEAPMPVSGAPSRGVLSWAFEQGLSTNGASATRAAADLDHDGRVTVSEIGVYLDSQVRALTGQRQQPRTSYAAAAADLVLLGKDAPHHPAEPAALPGVLTLGAAAHHDDTAPWHDVARRDDADFIWDVAQGTVLRRSGDMVAQGVTTPAALRGVIEKWNTVEALRPLINERGLHLAIGPRANGVRYVPGEQVTIALGRTGADAAPRYATIVNLAADGTVQRLFPLTAEDGAGQVAADGTLPVFTNRVVAPFGADHIVALVTAAQPVLLQTMLRSIEGQRQALRLTAPIRDLLASGGGLSIGEIYTGAR